MSPVTHSADFMQRFVILDFETTGLDPLESEIIEVGATRVFFDPATGPVIDKKFSQLVRPSHPVPRVISQLTGISQEMVETQPTLQEALPAITDFLGTDPLVAHNSTMEQRFLDVHVTPLNHQQYMVHNSVDPLALIFPDHMSVSLDSFRRWAHIHREDTHRALADCEDLFIVLSKAWEHVQTARPELFKLVQRYLHDWWWAPLFQPRSLGAATVATLPSAGDLDSLRKQDAEIETTPAVSTEQFEAIQHGIQTAFAEDLPRVGLSLRPAQVEMAQSVASTFHLGERMALEAPTGTGKSIAYLVPAALMAHQTGVPVVIATHSKTLQDQLLEKDIPLLEKALSEKLGKPTRATTVKGQDNYLCLRKLHEVADQLESSPMWEDRWSVAFLLSYAFLSNRVELDKISRFVRSSFQGLPLLIDRIKSHHTTTLGPPCRFYRQCHFFNAARVAHQSQVVIANHALVFSWPQHLPKIRNIIFDEAHHLEDQITQANSLELREADISSAVERLMPAPSAGPGRRHLRDFEKLERLLGDLSPSSAHATHALTGEVLADSFAQIKTRLRDLKEMLPSSIPKKGDHVTNPLEGPLLDRFAELRGSVLSVVTHFQTLETLVQKISRKPDGLSDLMRTYANRFETWLETLNAFVDTVTPDQLRTLHWTSPDWTWRLSVEPINVPPLTEAVFRDMHAVVLTSATLSTGTKTDFIMQRIGLKLSQPLRVLPSPFRLDQQARVYFPTDVASPGTSEHLASLIDFTQSVVMALAGRTLLLLTSNVRMRKAVEELRARLEPQGVEVFDSISDPQAHEGFRTAFHEGRRALLVGSERYGEGLDIPGDALSCVIIEKINEAMTRGPLAQARSAKTKFGLYDYEFPLRMIWLRQRIGRLIRSTTDTGAVVVFDSRPSRWAPASKSHVFRAIAPIPVEELARGDILKNLEYFSTFAGSQLKS